MATLESKKAATLGKRSIIGMIIGLALGAILCFVPNGYIRDDIVINTILNIVGNGYLNLIKMTIIPFVFASLVMGISSATDIKQVGRIGGKILLIYVATTVIASAFGILGGMILKPGVGVDLGSFDLSNTYENVNTSFASVILDFIPTNIVESFAKGKMIHIVVFAVFFGIALSLIGEKAKAVKEFNESLANTMLNIVESFAKGKMIHIVVFAVFFGIALSLIGEKAKAVKEFNESLANTMLKIVNIVMQLTPYGVCALMAKTVANLGFTIIVTLAKYCASEIFLLFLFGLLVYGLMLKLFTGLSYGRFLKKYSRIALVPFSTSSSNATLPYSIEFCRSIGVSEKVASFTLPLGATLNMDGSAIMQGMTAVFVAQLYNIELTWPMIVTIVIAATLGTIGSPGMPGVVMVTLTVVLQSVGFPLEAIAIIVAIDKFPDMFKTVLNVLGDSVDTVIVAKSEGEFDADVFNGLKEADVNVGE